MALGSIFGRFWAQVGTEIEAKLVPKFEKMGYQIDVEKSSKNKSHKEIRGAATKLRKLVAVPKRIPPGSSKLEYKSTRRTDE